MDWTLIAVVAIVVAGFVTVWTYDLRFRHAYINWLSERNAWTKTKEQWDTWTIKPMQVEVKTDHTVVTPKRKHESRNFMKELRDLVMDAEHTYSVADLIVVLYAMADRIDQLQEQVNNIPPPPIEWMKLD